VFNGKEAHGQNGKSRSPENYRFSFQEANAFLDARIRLIRLNARPCTAKLHRERLRRSETRWGSRDAPRRFLLALPWAVFRRIPMKGAALSKNPLYSTRNSATGAFQANPKTDLGVHVDAVLNYLHLLGHILCFIKDDIARFCNVIARIEFANLKCFVDFFCHLTLGGTQFPRSGPSFCQSFFCHFGSVIFLPTIFLPISAPPVSVAIVANQPYGLAAPKA
jgi:hypothetical protein